MGLHLADSFSFETVVASESILLNGLLVEELLSLFVAHARLKSSQGSTSCFFLAVLLYQSRQSLVIAVLLLPAVSVLRTMV